MCFGRNLSDSKILCGGLLQQRLRSLNFSPRSDPLQLILTRNSLQSKTEYRCIVPISQIFYSQYHKWDILGFGLKSKVFVEKQQLNDRNHGLTVPKRVLILYLDNLRNWPNCLECPQSIQLANSWTL